MTHFFTLPSALAHLITAATIIGIISLSSMAALACPYGEYENSDGDCVYRPDYGRSSAATAICQDGEESFSHHRSGTCSSHGGVRGWLK